MIGHALAHSDKFMNNQHELQRVFTQKSNAFHSVKHAPISFIHHVREK